MLKAEKHTIKEIQQILCATPLPLYVYDNNTEEVQRIARVRGLTPEERHGDYECKIWLVDKDCSSVVHTAEEVEMEWDDTLYCSTDSESLADEIAEMKKEHPYPDLEDAVATCEMFYEDDEKLESERLSSLIHFLQDTYMAMRVYSGEMGRRAGKMHGKLSDEIVQRLSDD